MISNPSGLLREIVKQEYSRADIFTARKERMNIYRIGIFEEIGGYVTISANNKKEAENKVDEILENDGVAGFQDFDTTHRDVSIVDSAKKI